MDVNPYQSPVEDPSAELGSDLDHGGQFLASRGARFGAALLDSVVMMVIVLPIQWAAGWFETLMRSGGEVPLDQQLMWTAIGFVIWFCIQVAFLRNGQTIGKKALGIRMVDYSTGGPVPLGRLVGLRYLPTQVVVSIPTIGPLLNLVNILFIFGGEQRCIHDLIAGTKVVQA